jgi:hypothetical protein
MTGQTSGCERAVDGKSFEGSKVSLPGMNSRKRTGMPSCKKPFSGSSRGGDQELSPNRQESGARRRKK